MIILIFAISIHKFPTSNFVLWIYVHRRKIGSEYSDTFVHSFEIILRYFEVVQSYVHIMLMNEILSNFTWFMQLLDQQFLFLNFKMLCETHLILCNLITN